MKGSHIFFISDEQSKAFFEKFAGVGQISPASSCRYAGHSGSFGRLFHGLPMQPAFAQQDSSPPESASENLPPQTTDDLSSDETQISDTHAVTLQLPSNLPDDGAGSPDEGDSAPPPSGSDGGFSALSGEAPFPFDESRISHENRPKLETDQNNGALTYTYPLAVPPGRNGPHSRPLPRV
jgi:hypothetical protein